MPAWAPPPQYNTVSAQRIPTNMTALFDWCEALFFYDHTVNPIINKLAEYPVSGLRYESIEKEEGQPLNAETEKRWRLIMEKVLKIKSKLIEINLDREIFGNAFVSVFFPTKRIVTCELCDKRFSIEKIYENQKYVPKGTKDKNGNFALYLRGKCPKCNRKSARLNVHDVRQKSPQRMKLIRWYPKYIRIAHNIFSNSSIYTFTPPAKAINGIKQGNYLYLCDTPMVFIEAALTDRDIRLNNKHLFHFKRSSPSSSLETSAWGIPALLPALQRAYWLQILRKAQEAISLNHINPLQILYPTSTPEAPITQTMSLAQWRSKVENIITQWKDNPSYIGFAPCPIGYETIGGDARALLVTDQEELAERSIAQALGVPYEFIAGGLSWSGSSVSLRMLENHFLTTIGQLDEFLTWLKDQLKIYFSLPDINIKQREFKLADDPVYKQYAYQLWQAGLLSGEELLGDFGKQYSIEKERVEREKKEQAELTADIQNIIMTEQQKTMIANQDIAKQMMQQQEAAAGTAAPKPTPKAG